MAAHRSLPLKHHLIDSTEPEIEENPGQSTKDGLHTKLEASTVRGGTFPHFTETFASTHLPSGLAGVALNAQITKTEPPANSTRPTPRSTIDYVLSNERKFRCVQKECRNSTFRSLAGLRRHYEANHGPSNRGAYYCPHSGCPRSRKSEGGKGKSFGTRKDRCEKHIRRMHGGIEDGEGAASNAPRTGGIEERRPGAVPTCSGELPAPGEKEEKPKQVTFVFAPATALPSQTRIPLRVNIFPSDSTESISTTVKKFYGLYNDEVEFLDTHGRIFSPQYENLHDNIIVTVKPIEAKANMGSEKFPFDTREYVFGCRHPTCYAIFKWDVLRQQHESREHGMEHNEPEYGIKTTTRKEPARGDQASSDEAHTIHSRASPSRPNFPNLGPAAPQFANDSVVAQVSPKGDDGRPSVMELNIHLHPTVLAKVVKYVESARRHRYENKYGHELNVGPYHCTHTFCSYRTTRLYDWRRHEEIHEPQEIWLCDVCLQNGHPIVFIVNRGDKFIRHVETSHPGLDAYEVLKLSKVDYRPYIDPKCFLCDKVSTTWDERCKHIPEHFEDNMHNASRQNSANPLLDNGDGLEHFENNMHTMSRQNSVSSLMVNLDGPGHFENNMHNMSRHNSVDLLLDNGDGYTEPLNDSASSRFPGAMANAEPEPQPSDDPLPTNPAYQEPINNEPTSRTPIKSLYLAPDDVLPGTCNLCGESIEYCPHKRPYFDPGSEHDIYTFRPTTRAPSFPSWSLAGWNANPEQEPTFTAEAFLSHHDGYARPDPASLIAASWQSAETAVAYVVRACNRCRRRKIRCDGAVQCRWCKRAGADCIYTPLAFKNPYPESSADPSQPNRDEAQRKTMDGIDPLAKAAFNPHIQEQEPPTDSGYASAQHYKSANIPEQPFESEEDGATVYTQDSDLNSTMRDSYISEFAQLLFDSLPGDGATFRELQKLQAPLEGLLRSFAVRLAHNTGREVLEIGAFIHRNRQSIVNNFNMLGTETCDSPVLSPRGAGGMTYSEKIHAWTIENPEHIDIPTFQEELDDDDQSEVDEGDQHLPEIPNYRKTIESCGAYTWLVAQLKRERTLSHTQTAIREHILRALPKVPRISRRSAEHIKAVYTVQWDLKQFLQSQQYKEDIGYAFENAITITGDGDHTQAATCIGYMEQTWPAMGECLVRALKSAIQSEDGVRHMSTAIDETVLTAWIVDNNVIVEAEGSRDSITDVAEQLAWLGSSLRPSLIAGGPVFCSAQTNHVSVKMLPDSRSSPSIELHCTIGFTMTFFDHYNHLPRTNGSCWRNLFRNPVIATGFPIPTRDDDDKQCGLEIPLSMMATLAQAKRVTLFDGKIVVKGFSTMLFPTRNTGKTIVWHLIYNERGQRLQYTDPRIAVLPDSTVDTIGMAEILHSRHILGWASSTEIISGSGDANYNIRRSGYSNSVPGCILDKVSLSAGKFVTVGASVAVGVREVPLHLNREGSYVEQIQDAYNNYVILYDVDDKRAWLTNGATALLHIVRASLHDTLTGKFKAHCEFRPEELQESPIPYTSDSAIDVLTCRSNMELKVARDKDEIWTESTTTKDGRKHTVIRKQKFVYFQDIVENKYHILEQILDLQSKKMRDGIALGVPGRQYLDGFDFTDVATRIQDLQPRVTALQSRGKSWIDFTRSIGAVTLFGRGFGELIRPAKDSNNLCPQWKTVPTGMDYLAVSVSDLEEISKRRGDPEAIPMRLVGNICWHKPDKLVEACHCKGKRLKRKFCGLNSTCDRVQVLLPLTSRAPRWISPGPLDGIRNGAVIFGYSKTFPLRWRDRGDPEEGEPSPPPEGPTPTFTDSGLGSSVPSSTTSEDRDSSRKGKRTKS